MKALALLLAIIFSAGCGAPPELSCEQATVAHYEAGCFETYPDGTYLPQKTFEEYCLALEYNSYEKKGYCLPEMDRFLGCLNNGWPCGCKKLEGQLKTCLSKSME